MFGSGEAKRTVISARSTRPPGKTSRLGMNRCFAPRIAHQHVGLVILEAQHDQAGGVFGADRPGVVLPILGISRGAVQRVTGRRHARSKHL